MIGWREAGFYANMFAPSSGGGQAVWAQATHEVP